jgi:hypothetical protein
MRVRVGSAIAATACVLALAAPAGAQQAPTLGAPPTPDVTVQTAQTTSSGGGGLATWQEVLIFAAGIILIGGIAVAILADSRERAGRLGHGRAAVTEPGEAPHRHKQRSKQQARAKGKQQRAARRRNR